MAKATVYKGLFSSKLLFDLVLRLKNIEIKYHVNIHFIHVAGTRMITRGSGCLSRGLLYEGVMRGGNVLAFAPLHLLALDAFLALET